MFYPKYHLAYTTIVHMASRKGLYALLKESNQIEKEELTGPLYRSREKATGYMWEGRMEVFLTNGTKVSFSLHHHFHCDIGGDWTPTEQELLYAWRPCFIPSTPEPGCKRVDAYWYSMYVGDHIYITATGFFETDNKSELIESIENGTWEQNPDIWRIV